MRHRSKEPRRQTISKINYTDRKEKVEHKLKYYVGSGNNSSLIRRVMSTRKNWEEVSDSKFLFLNFKWQQTVRGFNFDNCVDSKVFKHCLNHFEFHQELSNKEYLFKNLTDYCEMNKINVFDFIPVTYCLSLSDPHFDTNQNQFLKFFQLNIPGNLKSTNKKHWLTLPKKRFMNSAQKKTSYFYSKPELKSVYISPNSQYLWILKPSFCNQGHGIHIFNEIQHLQDLIKTYIENSTQKESNKMVRSSIIQSQSQVKSKSFRIREVHATSRARISSFIIQKYLQRPLLFEDRKFDVRVWVLFTHEFKVYFFKEGYIRTSSSSYSTNVETMEDINVHLTNNAIQKHCKDYGKFEEGNQLSFRHLRSLISKYGKNPQETINEMKKIVRLSAMSIRRKLNKISRQWCFELFGYDFMIDEECKPWLIQVNTNPSLEQSSLLLQNILPRMIDDAFKMTIDTIFDEGKQGNRAPYVLQHYENEENLWQFIIDLKKTGL